MCTDLGLTMFVDYNDSTQLRLVIERTRPINLRPAQFPLLGSRYGELGLGTLLQQVPDRVKAWMAAANASVKATDRLQQLECYAIVNYFESGGEESDDSDEDAQYRGKKHRRRKGKAARTGTCWLCMILCGVLIE